jgi:hypothetical protein
MRVGCLPGIDPVEHAKLEKIARSLAATHCVRGGGQGMARQDSAEGAAPMTVKARWLLAKLCRRLEGAHRRNLCA